MLNIFKTDGNRLIRQKNIAPNCWVELSNPTEEEILKVADACDVSSEALRTPLDMEETSYLEIIEGYSLVTMDIPTRAMHDEAERFSTIPLCAIVTNGNIITSCKKPLSDFNKSIDRNLRDFSTEDHHRFVFRLLLIVTEVYQQCLRAMERERADMESQLGERTDNCQLLRLHELETSLVYFETSLRANRLTLDRIKGAAQLKLAPGDRDLLKEVGRETDQAIEMATLYRSIIQSTRELFASVLNNGLNSVMKRLTSLTIILAVPTIIGGLYGMNVEASGMPLAGYPFAFAVISLITIAVCVALALWLRKKNLL